MVKWQLKFDAIREPEPYKGKGIKYENEIIRRKAGKAGKAGRSSYWTSNLINYMINLVMMIMYRRNMLRD